MELVLYLPSFSVAVINEHTLIEALSVISSLWSYIGRIYLWWCGGWCLVNILPGFLCIVSKRHGKGLVWFDIESNKIAYLWLLVIFGALYFLKCCLQWKKFSFRECRWLFVANFVEVGVNRSRLLSVVKKGSNFCFCDWSYHIFLFNTVCTALFLSQVVRSIKKCPPALLKTFRSYKYDLLLWILRILSLAWYLSF